MADHLSTRTTEYLIFTEVPTMRKTRIWQVSSLRHGDVLGHIRWYGQWRQYTFLPNPETIWNTGCLTDIKNFLDDAMADWRASRGAAEGT